MKFLSEFLPLIIFYISYNFYGDIIIATGILVFTTLISTAMLYLANKEVSPMLLIATAFLAVMGGITYFTGDPTYIKMKPTIVNLLFASVLLGAIILKKPLLQKIFGNAFVMDANKWHKLSIAWCMFLVFNAGLNEYVWRNYSESTWVNFKAFGLMGISIVFSIITVFYMVRNIKPEEDTKVAEAEQ